MKQPSRALILGLNYPPETTGISPYTGAMAAGLARLGYKVRALVSHPHYPEWKIAPGYGGWAKRESLDGVTVDRLLHFVPRHPAPVPRALSEVSFGLRQVFSRWGTPSAIIAVSPALFSSALVRLRCLVTHRRTPFVLWVQDLYGLGVRETGQGSGLAARAIQTVEGWLMRTASVVVVIHDRFADRVSEDFAVPRARIKVIRNWTHIPPLPPANIDVVRASLGWKQDETIVVHTGNMGIKQGLHHVVDAGRLAVRRGERVRFVLVGNGSQKRELEEAIGSEATTTEILAPLESKAFTDILQAADILLVNELPGVAEMALPSKLTSYFASGRPVLAATDASGITAQEVLAADAGITVPAGDPVALLDGARSLSVNRAEASRLGQNGKRYKETVLEETFAIQQFDSLLADLTANAAGKHSA